MEISQLQLRSDSSEELIGNLLTRTKIESQQRIEGCSLTYTESELPEEFAITINRIESAALVPAVACSLSYTESAIPSSFALPNGSLESERYLCEKSNQVGTLDSVRSRTSCLQPNMLKKGKPSNAEGQNLLVVQKLANENGKLVTPCDSDNRWIGESAKTSKISTPNQSPTNKQADCRTNTIQKRFRSDTTKLFRYESPDRVPTKKLIDRINEPTKVQKQAVNKSKNERTFQNPSKTPPCATHNRATPKLTTKKPALSVYKTSGGSRLEAYITTPIAFEQVLELCVDSHRIEVRPKPQADRQRKTSMSRSKCT